MPYCWVIFSQIEQTLCQGYESVHGFTILQMKMVHSFERTNNPKTLKMWFLCIMVGLQPIMSLCHFQSDLQDRETRSFWISENRRYEITERVENIFLTEQYPFVIITSYCIIIKFLW